ncbi:uncharacterized protein LOC131153819 [Malania oleifera]|uniref:uncharacterized protein LOC131153819 n=1 Tax=Malania oleifera TaxID=397392 RepID=UPI0025AE819D|nr:uncharacterized protein LOC131153819 [Malania oleifera]
MSSGNSLVNPSDDSSSPYYLHPSDNPGALLVSEIFNGENYVAWSRSIIIALTVKNKVQFIDGSIVSPPSDQFVKHTVWLRANNLVLSWLMNYISKEIRNSLLFVVSAVDLWNELKVRYLRSDGPRVFHLEKSLSCINQGTLSVTEYFNTFKTLWDEYINYRPFPTCTCGQMATCTCELFNFLQIRQQSDYVLKFLVGLNDSFAAVRSQLLLMVPLPSMSKVFSLLLQEESQRQLTNSSTYNETHALMLHGYPPGWNRQKGRRNEVSAHAAIMTPEVYNQNSNEPQKFCFTPEEFNKLMALANLAQLNSAQLNSSNQITTQPTVNLVTTSQFSGKFFSCNSVTSNTNFNLSWILDTGATDHMICSPLLYHSIPKPINASINLPNGTTVPATHIGTDQSMKKMIGIALEKEGLYHLIPASSKAESCNSFQFNSTPFALSSIHKPLDIWHCRLGHNIESASSHNNSPFSSAPHTHMVPDSSTLPSPSHMTPISASPTQEVLQPRKSTRIKQKPSYLQDYYCDYPHHIKLF